MSRRSGPRRRLPLVVPGKTTVPCIKPSSRTVAMPERANVAMHLTETSAKASGRVHRDEALPPAAFSRVFCLRSSLPVASQCRTIRVGFAAGACANRHL